MSNNIGMYWKEKDRMTFEWETLSCDNSNVIKIKNHNVRSDFYRTGRNIYKYTIYLLCAVKLPDEIINSISFLRFLIFNLYLE